LQAEKYIIISNFPDKNCGGTPKKLVINSGECISQKQACERGIDTECPNFNETSTAPFWTLSTQKYTCINGKITISRFIDGVCKNAMQEISAPTNTCGEVVSVELFQKSFFF
jgi:hypothetical protein